MEENATHGSTAAANQEINMTRTQYFEARRLIRDNGRYALNWLKGQIREDWDHLLFNIQDSKDVLAERADIVAWCNRDGVPYNFRHLANQ